MKQDITFLVVDDMEGMRRILINSLNQLGIRKIITAANGSEAWRILQVQAIDVLISDLNMPVMTGIDLLRKVRSTPKLADMPVLIMTAETERFQVQAALEAGVSEYIIKPFNVAALEAKLDRVIKQPRPTSLEQRKVVPAVLPPTGQLVPKTAEISLAHSANAATKPIILVVDDIPDNLDILVDLLSDEYQVKVANSGVRALKILASGKIPDLILLDVMMPELDGFEVCRQIRLNPSTADIPVMFLTAMNETVDVTRGFSVGALDFISKPADPPILRARIATQLRLRNTFEDLRQSRLALKEQNALLEENLRLRDEFERIAQHDLKNPIAGIINFSSNLLSETQLADEHKEIIEYIEQSAYNVLKMVNLSLDLYKMEQGSYIYHPSKVDLGKLLQRILNEVISELNAREISVQFSSHCEATPAPIDLYIAGDEILSYSMFSNLLRNAMEAARAHTVIQIELESTDDWVTIIMTNDGAVPEGIRETFFEKFSTSGKESGTGLGTFSAQLITQTQGGKIRMATSDESNTTTLTVRLPKASIA
ncbi:MULTISPECIES: hybrid sensor histidine kinase/response regulator [Undibacterium]|jgi:two-component system sensor histidine kinase/response regulator|uniref:histidine kinase n=1 Tax=Undibacterium umbellatum TaxID=2762300 RepID=A0ABR6Z9X2_9BURK|nr:MULTISPECIES: response regulator [Undibacterium]MBC3908555.1 response regulator [Undibacterium umbellatum]MDP1976648.1 response regulator [Undibacterium sp.]